MITIVDYGMGNVGSVFNMLRKLRAKVQISSDKNEIGQNQISLFCPVLAI